MALSVGIFALMAAVTFAPTVATDNDPTTTEPHPGSASSLAEPDLDRSGCNFLNPRDGAQGQRVQMPHRRV